MRTSTWWLSVLLMVAGIVGLIWGGTRGGLPLSSAASVSARLNIASDAEGVALLEQVASWKTPETALLVETLNSPRTSLSQAARRILFDRFDAWRWPATAESSARLQQLAEALAQQMPHFGAEGRAAASDLATRIACWPIDERYLNRQQLLKCCESVVVAAGKSPPGADKSLSAAAPPPLYEEPQPSLLPLANPGQPGAIAASEPNRLPPAAGADKIPKEAAAAKLIAVSGPPAAQPPSRMEYATGYIETSPPTASPVMRASAVEPLPDRLEDPNRRRYAGVDIWELFRRFMTADAGLQAELRKEFAARCVPDRDLTLACRLFDADAEVRKQAVASLPGIPGIEPTVWLWQAARDPYPDVRLAALSLLATTADPGLMQQVEAVARQDGDPRIQRLAEQIGQWRTGGKRD